MSVDKFPFGALADGTAVTAFRISRGAMSAVVLDYGATLQSLVVPGRTGAVDIVLGYENAGEYERREATPAEQSVGTLTASAAESSS